MNNMYVKILIATVLSFLGSTIKNPKSVAKFKNTFIMVRDGFNALIISLGGEETASTFAVRRNGKFDTETYLEALAKEQEKFKV